MRTPRRWIRVLAVFAAVALVASACGDDDDDEAADDETVEEFDGVTIVATDYEFDAPDTMEASTVNMQLVNEGNTAHEAVFVKIGDQEPEEFIAEFDEFVDIGFSGPPPDAFYDGGANSIPDVQPHEGSLQSELTMTEGTWLLFCALDDSATESPDDEGGGGSGDEPSGRAQEDEGEEEGGEEGGEGPSLPPHYRAGMWQVVEVTGSTEPEAPEGTTIGLEDYTFTGAEDLEAGEQTLVAVNNGPDELHHLVAFDFGKGVTVEDAEKQFAELAGGGDGEEGEEEGGGSGDGPSGRAQEDESEEEGGGEPPEAFFSGIMSPGYGQTLKASLQSGHTYLMACFIADRAGGPPHAIAHNMIKAFTVK